MEICYVDYVTWNKIHPKIYCVTAKHWIAKDRKFLKNHKLGKIQEPIEHTRLKTGTNLYKKKRGRVGI